MKISMTEAAINLEKICDDIECAEDISPQLQELFHDANLTLQEGVDRRLSFLSYAHAQKKHAIDLRDSWANRVSKFETIIEEIKADTMATMKLYPNLPYSGDLGTFKVQKNSVPMLDLIEDFEKIAPLEYLKEITEVTINRKKLREDLTAGRTVEGAKLVHGDHLRVVLKTETKLKTGGEK